MVRRDEKDLSRRLARPALLALPYALLTASIAPAQVPPPPGAVQKVGYVEGSIRVHIFRARMVALEKLRSGKCGRLFAEFQDLEGRALDDVLRAREETSEQHLRRMDFRDGLGTPTCGRNGISAFTSPGSLTVFVCPAFPQIAWQNAGTAANILIHEELHSLGAGEAPMSGLLTADDITARVEDRCGR